MIKNHLATILNIAGITTIIAFIVILSVRPSLLTLPFPTTTKTRPSTRKPLQQPVESIVVGRHDLSYPVTTYGRIMPLKHVQHVATIDGLIAETKVDEGATVESGKIVLVFDKKQLEIEVEQANANVKLAKANLQDADDQLRRARLSGQPSTIRLAEIQRNGAQGNVDAAEAQLKLVKLKRQHLEVKTRLNGTLAKWLVKEGQVVAAGTPLFIILQNHQLKVHFAVLSGHRPFLKPDQLIQIKPHHLPNVSLAGKVLHAAVAANPQTFGFDIDAIITDSIKSHPLHPGNSAQIQYDVKLKEIVVIPKEAVVNADGDTFCYGLERRGNTTFVKRIPARLQPLPQHPRLWRVVADEQGALPVLGEEIVFNTSRVLVESDPVLPVRGEWRP